MKEKNGEHPLGLSVSTASFFSLVMVVVTFIFYNHIAGYKERLRKDRFAEAHRKYKKRPENGYRRLADRAISTLPND